MSKKSQVLPNFEEKYFNKVTIFMLSKSSLNKTALQVWKSQQELLQLSKEDLAYIELQIESLLLRKKVISETIRRNADDLDRIVSLKKEEGEN